MEHQAPPDEDTPMEHELTSLPPPQPDHAATITPALPGRWQCTHVQDPADFVENQDLQQVQAWVQVTFPSLSLTDTTFCTLVFYIESVEITYSAIYSLP